MAQTMERTDVPPAQPSDEARRGICNWHVHGNYTLCVHVGVPDIPRRDKVNGQRCAQPVDVESKNVRIRTGVKKS